MKRDYSRKTYIPKYKNSTSLPYDRKKNEYKICGFFTTINELSYHLDTLKEQMINLRNFSIKAMFDFLKETGEKEFITLKDIMDLAQFYKVKLDRIIVKQLIKLHDTTLTATLDFEDFCSFLAPFEISEIEVNNCINRRPQEHEIYLFLRFLDMSCRFLKKMYEDSECKIVLREVNNETFDRVCEGVTSYDRRNYEKKLDFYSLKKYLDSHNFNLKEKDIVRILSMIDINKDGIIHGEEFRYFVDTLRGSKSSRYTLENITKKKRGSKEEEILANLDQRGHHYNEKIGQISPLRKIEFHAPEEKIEKVKYSNYESKRRLEERQPSDFRGVLGEIRISQDRNSLRRGASKVQYNEDCRRERDNQRDYWEKSPRNISLKNPCKKIPFGSCNFDIIKENRENENYLNYTKKIAKEFNDHDRDYKRTKSQHHFERKFKESERNTLKFGEKFNSKMTNYSSFCDINDYNSSIRKVEINYPSKTEKTLQNHKEKYNKTSRVKVPKLITNNENSFQNSEGSSLPKFERRNSNDTLKPMISFGIHENDFNTQIFETQSEKENQAQNDKNNFISEASFEKKKNFSKKITKKNSPIKIDQYKSKPQSRSRSPNLSPKIQDKNENTGEYFSKKLEKSPSFNYKAKEQRTLERKISPRKILGEIGGSLDNYTSNNTIYYPSFRTQKSSKLRDSKDNFKICENSVSTSKMSLKSIEQIDALTLCNLGKRSKETLENYVRTF